MPKKGHKQTEEHRTNSSKAQQGKKLSEEHKKKLSLALKGRKGKKHTQETKNKISVSKKGKPSGRRGHKASLETRFTMSNAASGKNSSFWKGGICSEERIIRRSLKYRLWKEAVLAKDNHTCQSCGSKKRPCAHHIKAFEDYPSLRFDVSNGQVLCRKCHPRHTEKSKRNNQHTHTMVAVT